MIAENKPNISVKERQRQLREEVILDTAARLIWVRGYTTMTMDDLAAEVGIAKATLYQHFSSKEGLMAQITVRGLRRYQEYIVSLPAQSALERLKLFTRRIVQDRSTPSDWPAIEVQGANWLLRGMPVRGEPLSRLQSEGESFGKLIYELIEEAKQEGDLRMDLPTPVCLKILSACWSSTDFGSIASEYPGEELGDAVVAVLFEGMQPNRPVEP